MAREKLSPNPELAARIRFLRNSLVPKMTQERFAEEIGVEVNTYRKYESGKHGIPDPMVVRIAAKLNCCPEYLYGNSNFTALSEESSR